MSATTNYSLEPAALQQSSELPLDSFPLCFGSPIRFAVLFLSQPRIWSTVQNTNNHTELSAVDQFLVPLGKQSDKHEMSNLVELLFPLFMSSF